ncbi:MAG: hypothetical protein ABW019_08285 [Chitinophagaceae bacterium]
MPYPQFDRNKIRFRALKERKNYVDIQKAQIKITDQPQGLSAHALTILEETATRIKTSRENGKSVMLTFGAHSIKNGLAPVLIEFIDKGWLTHLATNGAGIIHDWEFSFQGASSEDVRGNAARGEFGTWEETGYYINLALVMGAYHGLGYGESIGSFIEHEKLMIPSEEELLTKILEQYKEHPRQAALAAELLAVIREFNIPAGAMHVPHPYKQFSVQAAAYRKGIPFTSHPMFGHDIIYTHPMNSGVAIGRTAEHDFLSFADSVSNIDGGVYLSIGSAVMSPMIFEKSYSMSQNLALQQGESISRHYINVVDLSENSWDWSAGEPPKDNPAYYMRYCKTFSRMGGTMHYITADNRDFLLGLLHLLEN